MKRFVVLAALLAAVPLFVWSQVSGAKTYVIPIHGEIGPSLMIFVRRGIEKAETDNADFIVFDIDTFGGRVDSALQIATLIGSARSAVTVAFIPATAEGTGVSWSAGALISLACNRIYMAPGTSIGAAAPVYQTQAGMEMAEEKTVSAVRTQMAALAEKNGYPKSVARAMVDPDVELIEIYYGEDVILTSTDDLPDHEREAEKTGISFERGKTVSRTGKLLTLTAGDMEKYGISSGTVYDTDELFDEIAVSPAGVVYLEQSPLDRAAAYVTGAVITGILVLAGLVALYMEVTSPGFGVPGAVAIICFAVVFLGSALLGNVGSLELLLFLLGVVLLIVEIFLIPGFGITGASGIVLIAVALVLSRQDFILPEFPWESELLKKNLATIGLAVVASVVFFGLIIWRFPHLPFFSRLILQNPSPDGVIAVSEPGSVPPHAGLSAGDRGIALTILRPVGKGEFGGQHMEVRTAGEFIDDRAEIEVVSVHGNQILVKKV